MRRVGIAGLGAVGLALARSLDAGRLEGFGLSAVLSRSAEKARGAVAAFAAPPAVVVSPEELAAGAEIVVEAAPAHAFRTVAEPALEAGRILIACSGGALLRNMDLVATAKAHRARIIVPTGALVGLDAVRAAAEGTIATASIETRKPPAGWRGAPHLVGGGISLDGLTEATCIFEGNALEAAAGFPANVNVAAALALAGIGPDRTRVRLVADPAAERNVHTVRVESDAARFTLTIEGLPDPDNPRTGRLTPLSVLACLRGLDGALRIGS